MQPDSASMTHCAVLLTEMEGAGFTVFPWERWHYDFKCWESCFTQDLSHQSIRRANEMRKKVKAQ